MRFTQSIRRRDFYHSAPAFFSNIRHQGSYGANDFDGEGFEVPVGAEEFATEILMLTLIYNNYASNGSYSELAKFWETEGVADLGLQFDIQGRIHPDMLKIKYAYCRNSEKLQRLMMALWGAVEMALMGYQDDPV